MSLLARSLHYYREYEGPEPVEVTSYAADSVMITPLTLALELEPVGTPAIDVPLSQWTGSPRRG